VTEDRKCVSGGTDTERIERAEFFSLDGVLRAEEMVREASACDCHICRMAAKGMTSMAVLFRALYVSVRGTTGPLDELYQFTTDLVQRYPELNGPGVEKGGKS
jgi:hypothetical protein